jgi:hypothetical protein
MRHLTSRMEEMTRWYLTASCQAQQAFTEAPGDPLVSFLGSSEKVYYTSKIAISNGEHDGKQCQ